MILVFLALNYYYNYCRLVLLLYFNTFVWYNHDPDFAPRFAHLKVPLGAKSGS